MKDNDATEIETREDAERLLRRFSKDSCAMMLKPFKPPAECRPDGWMPFTAQGAKAYAGLVECVYMAGSLSDMRAEAENIVEELDGAFEGLVPACPDAESDPFDEIDEAEDSEAVKALVRKAFDELPKENAAQVLVYSYEVKKPWAKP
jgi:hypothetical protein